MSDTQTRHAATYDEPASGGSVVTLRDGPASGWEVAGGHGGTSFMSKHPPPGEKVGGSGTHTATESQGLGYRVEASGVQG